MNDRSISIIVPTLNCADDLGHLLRSIGRQQYTLGDVEVIVADGGSVDSTVAVARRAGCRVVANEDVTTEAGKARGLGAAKYPFMLSVDADNILIGDDWLARMMKPFEDEEIVASEAIAFGVVPGMKPLNRYFALLGMNDPLRLFIGDYDRFSMVTGRWTDLPMLRVVNREGYSKVTFDKNRPPTIGSNGFMARTEFVRRAVSDGLLVDVDILRLGAPGRFVSVAKSYPEIAHFYADSFSVFRRKQKRRVRDYLHYRSVGVRGDVLQGTSLRIIYFCISTITILPLVLQAIRGFRRAPSWVWLFHIPVCWVTLLTYAEGVVANWLGYGIMSRDGWGTR